jgi:hypothetical protein
MPQAVRAGGDTRLAVLTAEIRLFLDKARRALPHYREVGARLRVVKDLLPHGEFLPWLKRTLGVTPSMAARYMKVARYWTSIIEPAWRDNPDLGINEAALLPSRLADEVRRAEACRRVDSAGRGVRPAQLGVHAGDFRVAGASLPDNSVSLVFSDPPWFRSGIDIYADVAAFAARVLAPGGLALLYAGKLALPEVLAAVTRHLTYLSMLALYHGLHGSVTMRRVNLISTWCPLLLLCKGPAPGRPHWEARPDCLVPRPGKDKIYHNYQLNLNEVVDIIEHFSRPGSLVCDPCAGSATVGVACKKLGRRFVGYEIDPCMARRAAGRIRLAEAGAGAEAGC